ARRAGRHPALADPDPRRAGAPPGPRLDAPGRRDRTPRPLVGEAPGRARAPRRSASRAEEAGAPDMAIQQAGVTRSPRPSNLAEVLDLILDKGIVIDAYIRVSAVGIELLTIDARIVVASVDTYLRFAEAVNRLDLEQTG